MSEPQPGGILRAGTAATARRNRHASFSSAEPSAIEYTPQAPASTEYGTSSNVMQFSSAGQPGTGSNSSPYAQHSSSDAPQSAGRSAAGSVASSAKDGVARCFSRLRCRRDSPRDGPRRRPAQVGRGFTATNSGSESSCGVVWNSVISFCGRIIGSLWWSVVLSFFTVVLFFGSQIQDLLCPASSDVVWDVIFTMALVILSFDLILRSLAEPNFFALSLGGRILFGRDRSRHSEEAYSSGESPGCCQNKWFRIGSFMFWCDFISTMTLLYDISYINKRRQEMRTLFVTIDQMGFPVSGVADFNDEGPVETQLGARQVIIAVGKTARIAHFIRTMAVINTSSRFPLYRMLQYFDPLYWIQKGRRSARYQSGGLLSDMSDAAPQDGTDPNLSLQSGSVSMNRRRMSLSKRASFSEVGGVDPPVSTTEGDRGLFRRVISTFGCSSRTEEKARRNAAATKIQRAWRRSHGRKSSRTAKTKKKSSRFTVKSAAKSLMRRSGGGSASSSSKREAGSQVGFAMRELTGQRVAVGIMIALIFTVLFTYDEEDTTAPTTMVVLHNQTQNLKFGTLAISAARASSIPTLYLYTFVNGSTLNYPLAGTEPDLLREREKLLISVTQQGTDTNTSGLFSIRQDVNDVALVELVSTIFIILVWFSGVTAFAGPVMTLVVVPIERMIRLLHMLMEDPLGYQGSGKYKKFVAEEDEFIKNTRWTKDVLKGMETSFLMSTILRIGSLMKVGFGSAGVEIIQGNLKKGQKKEITFLNTQGSTVSCIFLFCDIRQFTDATECLQEEVFVFTNKIAAVVHSYCAAYDGSANKNVGDAFLMSWLLDDPSKKKLQRDNDNFGTGTFGGGFGGGTLTGGFGGDDLTAKHNEGDKCLLSVVKICQALYYEKFFLESMSDNARGKLLAKVAKRKGTVVQVGLMC
uniref:Guanylate cyclase domain-containing protein n=1 Tax=Odontella aurita TaxID=265563 RepID=A0A7S4JJH8_9STRA|mmetsp:Transcript_47404/g.143497  ORF Transcript_47404/g.143497 Transcript_47404/m.143497 type:complete len:919 (+) Transcript_47404:195-2951(+)